MKVVVKVRATMDKKMSWKSQAQTRLRVGQFLLLISMTVNYWGLCGGEITCPSYHEIPFCSCFVLDDQLHIQCSGNDIPALEKSLQVLNGPVKSFSVYDLDSSATILPNGVTDNVTSPVFHLQLSHSSLEDLGEGSLRGLSKSLESLAVISARLKYIPQTTLSTLKRLKVLDLEGNSIQELGPYSFHDILLQKVSLKGNQLQNVSEHSFWGLEETLMEIDMSENKLHEFPYPSLRRLRSLSSLNLAWNELSELLILSSTPRAVQVPMSESRKDSSSSFMIEWPLLKYLNLNSNYLRKLDKDTFSSMRNLKTLAIHLNSIEIVDEDAFRSLAYLESLDLSHNKIVRLRSGVFRHNSRLLSLDLSNNHLHALDEGLLNNLRELREVFINGNNILQITATTFFGSGNVQILYLQQNALRFVESGVFGPLRNLSEVRLSDNFLRVLPQDLFLHNEALTSLSLDGNLLQKVVPGTFHNCKELKELRLQNNKITTIPPGVLDVLPNLEEVYLENNKLSLIHGLDTLKGIRHISLSRNHLERLTAIMLPATELSSLSLGNNLIRNIEDGSFANQTSLSILFIGNNRLGRIGSKAFVGLRSLERLYLQRNNISWIHNEALSVQTKALQYIDLSYNAFRSLSKNLFTGLAFIEEINLSHNEILSLDDGAFANLRSLRIIDLSNNRLSSLDYSVIFHMSGLEILKICCNSITEFTGVGKGLGASGSGSGSTTSTLDQIGLKELDVRENLLQGSALRQMEMRQLSVLQVSGNNLTDLDENTLVGFPSLSFLAADKCHIMSLPAEVFRPNPHLAVLRLSENGLSWIPDNICSPPTINSGGKYVAGPILRELHLRHNRLRNFPYKALANCSRLEILTLAGNRLNQLDVNRIQLPRLKQFDMNDNRLSKITGFSLGKAMPSLEVVDFGENNISRLSDDFLKNISLSRVNFGGNGLLKIPFTFSAMYLSSPFVLNMSGNPLVNFYTENHPSWNFSVMDLYLSDTNVSFLTSEEFKVYPGLHRLVIKRNPLSVLPANAFSSLVNLNLLDLSENEIENVKHDSLAGLVQLKSLNLSHNQIKGFTSFHPHLSGLQDLDLSSNQLSRLLPEAFTNLISLVSLRLRGNWLTNLPTDLFGPLARLSILDLSHNFIETIPPTVLRHLETRISTLRLEDNPLSCDCDSKDFWEWLQSHPKILSSTSGTVEGNFVCERPEEYRGRLMMESDLPSFCSSPAIVNLAIQDVRPSSAVVSWQGRNNSAMQGYVVAYHALNHNDIVRTRPLPASSRFYLLPDLQSDTPYLVCVLGLANDDNANNVTTSALSQRSADVLLKDSPFSKCTNLKTLGYGESERSSSLLQRRLGVLVGAVVGVVFFVILITTLACLKIRKRRLHRQENGKIDHRVGDALPTTNNVGTLGGYHHNNHHHYPHLRNGNGNGTSTPGNLSPEFLTYRHYSVASDGMVSGGLHPSHTTTTELERL